MSRNGVAVCPGSYDPVTNGHVDIITRAARVFDRVVVGVVDVQVRKQAPMFEAKQRRAFLEEALAHLDNVEVAVFCRNLEDTVYKNFAFDATNFSQVVLNFVGTPRTVGADVIITF